MKKKKKKRRRNETLASLWPCAGTRPYSQRVLPHSHEKPRGGECCLEERKGRKKRKEKKETKRNRLTSRCGPRTGRWRLQLSLHETFRPHNRRRTRGDETEDEKHFLLSVLAAETWLWIVEHNKLHNASRKGWLYTKLSKISQNTPGMSHFGVLFKYLR